MEMYPDALRNLGVRGSFRDPIGRVFMVKGEVYRYVVEEGFRDIENTIETPWFRRLVAAGKVIPTRVIAADESQELREIMMGAAERVLWHEKVPFVTYPYEWTAGMCVDAGLLTLDLQESLLGENRSLKDASPYNVQFVGYRPVFVDVCSIESCSRTGIWKAYDQFCRFWIFPLLLHRGGLRDFRSLYLTRLDGLSIEEVSGLVGLWPAIRYGLFLDYLAPVVLSSSRVGKWLTSRGVGFKDRSYAREIQLITVRRCRRVLKKLGKFRSKSSWTNYADEEHYSPDAKLQKLRFLDSLLSGGQIKDLIDLGCNTGTYAVLAAERGIRVVAVDSDMACLEELYAVAKNKTLNIVPLCLDIANPTPAIGWLNEEREAFLERADQQFDCVLSLALTHHLLVCNRAPLEFVAQLEAKLTRRFLVAEFVASQDRRFRDLLRYRDETYDWYNLEYFKTIYSEYFSIAAEKSLVDEARQLYRTLFIMERRR